MYVIFSKSLEFVLEFLENFLEFFGFMLKFVGIFFGILWKFFWNYFGILKGKCAREGDFFPGATFLIRESNAFFFKYPLFDGMGDAYFKGYA